jgi:hypothetical protein
LNELRKKTIKFTTMKLYEVSGTYGSGKTPCAIFVAEETYRAWYCVGGSVNVNCTVEDITNGVNVEELRDIVMFTAGKPIESLEELENAINSYSIS